MAEKVKASKVKVHQPPEGTTGLDGHFYVYVYDVFNKEFLAGKSFDEIEKAAAFQRSDQERIYAEQEADPELFDLPFVSADPDLVTRVAGNAEYKEQLMKALASEARSRTKHR
jgi:hypothetical protein